MLFTPGKFSQAISLSGTALSPWALPLNQTELAEKLAASVGCPPVRSMGTVDCLRNKRGLDIVSAKAYLKVFISVFHCLDGIDLKARVCFLCTTLSPMEDILVWICHLPLKKCFG